MSSDFSPVVLYPQPPIACLQGSSSYPSVYLEIMKRLQCARHFMEPYEQQETGEKPHSSVDHSSYPQELIVSEETVLHQ